MAITDADITTYLSGGAANADKDASIGGAKSSETWAGGTLQDLFDRVSGAENAASDVEYRCVYYQNDHGSLTATAGVLFIASETAGGAAFALGLDPAGVDGTAATIADEGTAPAGVTFSAPTTEGAGIAMPDLDPGESIAVWFRRTAADTAAVANDGATVRYMFDSEA